MTNVEALKALYVALGGDAADVANATTITAVLNAIAAKYEGANDATTNAEAIANIADVAGNIIPEPTLIKKSITENGTYTAADDNADGYSSVVVDVAQTNNVLLGFDETDNISMKSVIYINVPPGYNTIGSGVFGEMLENIVIPATVTKINLNAFTFCRDLETITINKPEGSIAGAPWGAPSTTRVVWTG